MQTIQQSTTANQGIWTRQCRDFQMSNLGLCTMGKDKAPMPGYLLRLHGMDPSFQPNLWQSVIQPTILCYHCASSSQPVACSTFKVLLMYLIADSAQSIACAQVQLTMNPEGIANSPGPSSSSAWVDGYPQTQNPVSPWTRCESILRYLLLSSPLGRREQQKI